MDEVLRMAERRIRYMRSLMGDCILITPDEWHAKTAEIERLRSRMSESEIGDAYNQGRRAAEANKSLDESPHSRGTEQDDAWRSGWIDRMNQLKRLKSDA